MLDLDNIVGFEWDGDNEYKNEEKHNVTSKKAEEVFKNEPFLNSAKSVDGEERYLALGETDSGRLLAVVFTVRDNKIRVISARPQSKQERKIYNAKIKDKE